MNKQSLHNHHLYQVTDLLDWLDHALSPTLGNIQKIETVKQRPWSQVYCIQAERGKAYFKICEIGRQHEVELLQWLIPEYSTIIPEVIALNVERAWILMADGGIPLRELPQPEVHSDRIATLLTNYAKLQQHSLAHIDTLLKIKLPDLRLHRLSDLVQDLLITLRLKA